MPEQAVHVTGLNELVRAFKIANLAVAKDVRTAIEQSGEPIRQMGSELIHQELSGMQRSQVPWWRLRIGIERNTIGYVVPEQRGVKSRTLKGRRRPNLAPLIAEREGRALAENRDRVYDEFVDAMNEVARAWARV